MQEQDLRRITEAARQEAPLIIRDEAVVAEVDAALAAALALPAGEAKAALRDALARHPSVRRWADEQLPAAAEGRRALPQPLGVPVALVYVRYVCPEGDEDFFQSRVDEPVPLCGLHGVALEREDR